MQPIEFIKVVLVVTSVTLAFLCLAAWLGPPNATAVLIPSARIQVTKVYSGYEGNVIEIRDSERKVVHKVFVGSRPILLETYPMEAEKK